MKVNITEKELRAIEAAVDAFSSNMDGASDEYTREHEPFLKALQGLSRKCRESGPVLVLAGPDTDFIGVLKKLGDDRLLVLDGRMPDAMPPKLEPETLEQTMNRAQRRKLKSQKVTNQRNLAV